jgi:hypothetical protein
VSVKCEYERLWWALTKQSCWIVLNVTRPSVWSYGPTLPLPLAPVHDKPGVTITQNNSLYKNPVANLHQFFHQPPKSCSVCYIVTLEPFQPMTSVNCILHSPFHVIIHVFWRWCSALVYTDIIITNFLVLRWDMPRMSSF